MDDRAADAVNLGVRSTTSMADFPEQHLGPALLFRRTANYSRSRRPSMNWHDISPRLGVAYDLFGNGKTAVKVSLGKLRSLGGRARRSATRSGRVANTVDAVVDRRQRQLRARLRPAQPARRQRRVRRDVELPTSASRRPARVYDPDMRCGWGKRPTTGSSRPACSTSSCRASAIDVGYFRRWFGNFTVTDNRADVGGRLQTRSASRRRSIRGCRTAAATRSTGLYNLNPNKVGQVDNYVTFAEQLRQADRALERRRRHRERAAAAAASCCRAA